MPACARLSDAVRERLYQMDQVYDADLRDQVLYGRVRPKLFTSEPSAVTFAYTHFSSIWLVISPWRYKLLAYFGLIAMALVVLPGPTLVLMVFLSAPYLVFLAGTRPGGRTSISRTVGMLSLAAVLVAAAVVFGSIFFAERLNELATGRDASFFYRFTGPMLVAFDMFRNHPWAGAGLTGEPFITNNVMNVYMNSPSFQAAWRISRIADVLTNYVWLHWIYLGLVWGVLTIVAVSVWLRLLGVPSVLYCWAVWIILGQASGAYVGPKTWSVMLIAAAASILAVDVAGAAAHEPANDGVPSEPAILQQPVEGPCFMNVPAQQSWVSVESPFILVADAVARSAHRLRGNRRCLGSRMPGTCTSRLSCRPSGSSRCST